MKTKSTIIIYSGRYGATESCARHLARLLGPDCALIRAEDATPADWQDRSRVILGGSIHVGKLSPALRRLIDSHGAELAARQLGLFVLCGDPSVDHFAATIPGPILDAAAARAVFGGALDLAKVPAWLRALLWLKGVRASYNRIDPAAIERFAHALNSGEAAR